MNVILALGLAASAAEPPDVPDLIDAVVMVHTGSSMCAGAFVTPQGHVATAYHCVSAGGRPMITNRAGTQWRGKIVATHVGDDLAVIAVPDAARQPFLEIASERATVGERVRVIGHPFGVNPPTRFMTGTLRWSMSEGIVSNVGPRAIQFTAPVNSGNSGGPIVDEQGRVVGVVSRRLKGDGMGFGGQSPTLRRLIDAEPKRLSPLGGTVEGNTLISGLDVPFGGVTAGVRVGIALRDTVIVDGTFALPIEGRFSALRAGRLTWSSSELRGGFRQRFGVHPFVLRLEEYGGVATVATWLGQRETLAIARRSSTEPLVGGALFINNVGIDVGYLPNIEHLRFTMVMRFPGTFWIF